MAEYNNTINYTSKNHLSWDQLADVATYWDNIKEAAEMLAEKREQEKIEGRQTVNKYLRGLVKHVHWSGNTCVIYWSDGTTTKSHWDMDEAFDPEKAILAAMARKLYYDHPVYCEVLRKYADAGWKHYDKMINLEYTIDDDDEEWLY